MSSGCFKGDSWVFHGSFKGVSIRFSIVFKGSSQVVSGGVVS